MTLTIVGGLYLERCIQPLWDAVFGSGGRAAAAVNGLVAKSVLFTYVPKVLAEDAAALAAHHRFELRAADANHALEFNYLHPLATPQIVPRLAHITVHSPINVEAELVLRFGMLEGDAIVHAETAVYDPQSAFGAQRFSSNGSRAKRLAIILNRSEAFSMTGLSDPEAAAKWLIQEDGAEVVVVKMGSQGAYVATLESVTVVPVYRTERVWKIGSGDVFSAAFAAFWGAQGIDPVSAADLASRATAMYCDTRMLPILGRQDLESADLVPVRPGRGTVYLAGPFFDIGQRWVIEETRALLLEMGAEVFSPVHEVGPGPGSIVAPEDIAGLERSDVVFAILNGLDTGTVFEIGYAVKKGLPVIALAQNVKAEDLKMVEGTGCEVVDDFASAIYRTLWRLPNR